MTGQTYVDATVTDVMNAGVDFAAFAVTGLSDIHVMGLTMNGTNNLRAPVAAGSVEALGIGYGRFELTGTMDIYYESSAALAAYLAGTAVSLTLTLGSITGKKYTFSVPKIKFETGEAPVGGNDEDYMFTVAWRGLRDSGIDGTLEITRAVA